MHDQFEWKNAFRFNGKLLCSPNFFSFVLSTICAYRIEIIDIIHNWLSRQIFDLYCLCDRNKYGIFIGFNENKQHWYIMWKQIPVAYTIEQYFKSSYNLAEEGCCFLTGGWNWRVRWGKRHSIEFPAHNFNVNFHRNVSGVIRFQWNGHNYYSFEGYSLSVLTQFNTTTKIKGNQRTFYVVFMQLLASGMELQMYTQTQNLSRLHCPLNGKHYTQPLSWVESNNNTKIRQQRKCKINEIYLWDFLYYK